MWLAESEPPDAAEAEAVASPQSTTAVCVSLLPGSEYVALMLTGVVTATGAIKEGDVIPMSPDGKQGMRVQSLEPPHSMVWGEPGGTTWAWQLDENADDTTRLITRVRSRYKWLSPSIAFSALLEFGDIWMMRKMLLNLRERATTTQG